MLRVNTRVDTQGDRTGGEERLNRGFSGVSVYTLASVHIHFQSLLLTFDSNADLADQCNISSRLPRVLDYV